MVIGKWQTLFTAKSRVKKFWSKSKGPKLDKTKSLSQPNLADLTNELRPITMYEMSLGYSIDGKSMFLSSVTLDPPFTFLTAYWTIPLASFNQKLCTTGFMDGYGPASPVLESSFKCDALRRTFLSRMHGQTLHVSNWLARCCWSDLWPLTFVSAL